MSSSNVQLPIKLDPAFWTKTSWIQLLYGVWINLAQLGIGLAFGFPAVQVPQLSSPDSDISITREEASWIASVLTLFSPIGCLLSGYMIDRFGRRVMIIACQGPMCVGWLYTGFAATSKEIIIGRAITGIGCGMAMGPPRIFCTEISLPNMRGVIGAFPAMAMSIGITTQAGLGSLLPWQVLCYICAGFTLMNLLIFNFLPESPYYVLMKSTTENARKTLAKFRDKKYDLDNEMDQLIDFKTDNDIRKLTILEKINALFTRASCKPFGLINTYILITQCSGISSILMWAIEILTKAQSSFDVHAGNFLLAITRLVVGTITSVLLFSVGRKPLALISAIGVSCVCFCLGTFIHYNEEPSLVPQFCFMAYMAFASLGYYTLPFLMMSELYPLQIRGTLGGITVSITSFLIFGSSKLYPYLRDHIGLDYTIILYGMCSLFGALFLYFFLPETKELTLQEIEEYYNDLRPSLVSQRRLMSLQRQLSLKSEQNISMQKAVEKHKKRKMSLSPDSAKTIKGNNGASIQTENKIIDSNSDKNTVNSKDIVQTRRSKESVMSKESWRNKVSLRSIESMISQESKKSEKSTKSQESKKSKASTKSQESKKSKQSTTSEALEKSKKSEIYKPRVVVVSEIVGSDETLHSQFGVPTTDDNNPSTSKKQGD